MVPPTIIAVPRSGCLSKSPANIAQTTIGAKPEEKVPHLVGFLARICAKDNQRDLGQLGGLK